MKKINNLAWMSAIALAGAMGFTACSSDDDTMENVNPSFDGKSVKTQIAINLPQAKLTRQSATVTQNDNAFRGMDGMTLIPLPQAPQAGLAFTTSSVVDLGDLGKLSLSTSQSSSKTYNDISIPVGTEHFLFYGEGEALSSSRETVENKAINGVLDYNFTSIKNTDNITFSVQKIDNETANTVRDQMVVILNAVLGTDGWAGQTDGTPLKSLYNEFKLLKSASPNNVKEVMEDLYNAVAGMAEAPSASPQKPIAAAICTNIKTKFDVSGNLTDGYKITDFIGTKLATYLKSLSDANIPEGALAVEVKGSAFDVAGASVTSNDNSVVLDNLYYPASLMYYVNTPLRASDSDGEFTWPETAADWTTETYWTAWTSKKVLATTRKIALQDNIQYGVARLATTVQCATGGFLYDNAKVMGGATNDNRIAVPSAGFPVSAILVGGQPTQVGWEMLPIVDDNRTAVIYDSQMNDKVAGATVEVAAKSGSAQGVNYTMVLDNAIVTSGSPQQKVNIAVELTNNSGVDFYGANGLVPAGAKFYMVAQLDPTGSSTDVNRVFLKDYTTTANLKIGSLRGAYVTIPDLRSTKLQLGLSVDLAWQEGLTFDVTIR